MKKLSILLISLLFSLPILAQHTHTDDHAQTPKEVGQSNFAAIAEVVDRLMQDKKTDWNKVNIPALREHLVDMNNLMNHSTVTSKETDQTITFDISGESQVTDSIQRMVIAHAPMLANETGWKISTEKTNNGAIISIQAKDLNKVKGLGFYGIMTIGAHHQAHHLMIAKGHDPH